MSSTTATSTNHLGIPKAPFSENSNGLIEAGETPEKTLTRFEELLSKYRMMEFSLNNKRNRALSKIEELKKSITAINGLRANPTAPFNFELNDTLYGKAHLAQPENGLQTVHLWLGANVMLSYPVDEAITLLTEKLEEASSVLSCAEADILYVREQITTMEVNTARVYNIFVASRSKPQQS